MFYCLFMRLKLVSQTLAASLALDQISPSLTGSTLVWVLSAGLKVVIRVNSIHQRWGCHWALVWGTLMLIAGVSLELRTHNGAAEVGLFNRVLLSESLHSSAVSHTLTHPFEFLHKHTCAGSRVNEHPEKHSRRIALMCFTLLRSSK